VSARTCGHGRAIGEILAAGEAPTVFVQLHSQCAVVAGCPNRPKTGVTNRKEKVRPQSEIDKEIEEEEFKKLDMT